MVWRPLDELKSASRRIRKADEAQIARLVATIQSFGVCRPVLIDEDGAIVDGHSVVEAARRLGVGRVQCVVIDHLSAAERRALSVALNRTQETGVWDLEALKLEFEELVLEELPLEVTGFTAPEIDQIIWGDAEEGGPEVGPLEPELGEAAVSRRGDLWRLGKHRLLCGDATSLQDVAGLVDGEAVRLVLTDMPFNVPIHGHVTGGAHREFVQASGEMSRAEFEVFNAGWISVCLAVLMRGGLLATFIDWRSVAQVIQTAEALGLDLLNLIVWNKTNAGMGSLWRSQHELLPVFKLPGAEHVNNVALGRHGRWRSNVWTAPGASSLGSDARRGLKAHPTVKPSCLLQDMILDVTHRGDVVLDPFLGSGSTLIAAEATGRIGYGLELDPLYVDVAVRRFEAATGQTAVLAATGETYAQVTERRAADRHVAGEPPQQRSQPKPRVRVAALHREEVR